MGKSNFVFKKFQNPVTLAITIFILLLIGTLCYLKHTSTEGFSGSMNPDNNQATVALFYAPWCPHCKAVKPIFDKLNNEKVTSDNGIKVEFTSVNCDENTEAAEKYEIGGFPTIKAIKSGGETVEHEGGRSEEDIMAFAKSL